MCLKRGGALYGRLGWVLVGHDNIEPDGHSLPGQLLSEQPNHSLDRTATTPAFALNASEQYVLTDTRNRSYLPVPENFAVWAVHRHEEIVL